MGSLEGDRWWAYDPSPAFPTPAWAGDFPFFPQEGTTLGDRLIHAFDTLFSRGLGPVVIIGTDAPLLSKARLEEAFTALKTQEVVLGPALDGGYYLVGLARPRPGLFQNIPWSTPEVLAASLSHLTQAKVPHALLAPESDVDTADDLRRLWEDLARAPDRGRFSREALAPFQGRLFP